MFKSKMLHVVIVVLIVATCIVAAGSVTGCQVGGSFGGSLYYPKAHDVRDGKFGPTPALTTDERAGINSDAPREDGRSGLRRVGGQ